MKGYVRKVLAAVLALTICLGLTMPAYATNETNNLGVIFSVALDTPTITASNLDQTVVMRLTSSKEITVDGIGFTVRKTSPITIASITGGDKLGAYDDGATNLDTGITYWGSSNLENVSGVTEISVITLTVPANTPAGTYEVGVEGINLTKDYGTEWENGASATTTLTIVDKVTAEGYTASLNTLSSTVSVGDTVAVNVGVAHESDSVFAAGEVVVSYNNSLMTFNEEDSTLGTATVKDNAGTLTLEDYGADKSLGTGVYVLAFDAIADGSATVSLTSAAFVNKEDAVKSDLIAADCSSATISVTINKRVFEVTLPDIFTGPATVTDGESYTFSVADGTNYNYDSVTATVDGKTVDVIDNKDGTYTVNNVTGKLVITGSRTEKTYTVTVKGNAADEITDAADTATYNTPYSFAIPAAEGWAYSLDSIEIGGTPYTGYTVENSVCTIPGSAINGNIEITVNKSQTIASITVEGTGAGAAAGYKTSATIGEEYTLTIVPEAGYSYTVSAIMNNASIDVIDNNDNTYTIGNVTGNVVFTVNRTVIVDGVSIDSYLMLDGTNMWLIKNNTTLAEGKVPTYNGEKMFWSEKYDCYCYLDIAETLTTEAASEKVDITEGSATNVDYGMDVNITRNVDASDCQLVYNIYNAMYDTFTSDMSVEKFLRADVNGDGMVDVEDATAIVDFLLG